MDKRFKWNKDKIIKLIKEIYADKTSCSLSYEKLSIQYNLPSRGVINKYFGSLVNLLNECEIITLLNKPEEYLTNELHRFIKEHNRLPTSIDFEGLKGYPARKTFSKYFGSVNNALIKIGYGDYDFIKDGMITTLNKEKEYESMSIQQKKKYLINKIYEYKNTYNKIPTMEELDKNVNYPNRSLYRTIFGGYNNALKEAGLELNQVYKYDDEFLKEEFLRFIDENGRVPYQLDFNNSEYPSFWCYQSRFGSWNKAVMAYGFEPNDCNAIYYLDNGEKCMSGYEYDISKWFNNHDIKYERDIPYMKIHNTYEGKMDCDYKITNDNKIYYVEMAGFYPKINSKPSEEEKYYAKKLHYKIRLLNEAKVNYLIIYPEDMKDKSLDEIFSFLKLN